ncbi:MAG: cation diffusion facilitator family transporter [Alphaproteobacteria bacterium]|nr:cation diffusion facilitator family transporter [Alphaproteobacteria bacterium]MDE2042106.1 cation transporter [Alphaproteobacteria bacterium]MDE2340771.1 cation transporter [Alphaproteobacteria bacterium]
MTHDHHHHDHEHDHHHHGHTHSHDHDHHHHGAGGHHHHGPSIEDGLGRYWAAVALNLIFVAVGVAVGIWANSTALLADAAHNLSDALGLVAAGGATWLATRPGSAKRTYGFGKATVLAALGNAIALVLVCGGIGWEALTRLWVPEATQGLPVMIVAAIGVTLNGGSALLFLKGRHGDANVRGAFLHLMSDALTSAAVIVAGALIWWSGAKWIDPLVSLGVCALILRGTWGLLVETMDMAMDAVPAGVDMAKLRTFLAALPGVDAVHDLHVWAMSTTENALTAHLVRPAGSDDAFLDALTHKIEHDFGIGHVTIQIEHSAGAHCPDHA